MKRYFFELRGSGGLLQWPKIVEHESDEGPYVLFTDAQAALKELAAEVITSLGHDVDCRSWSDEGCKCHYDALYAKLKSIIEQP